MLFELALHLEPQRHPGMAKLRRIEGSVFFFLSKADIIQRCKDPNNGVLGPKYYNRNSIWGLNPDHLGPWTLRDSSKGSCKVSVFGFLGLL